ncbi:MAG TPA: hypothetical protein DEH78_06775 [Solibacterales bacterium]|nr:hypothetical protein [Bryobacterales bacterium]
MRSGANYKHLTFDSDLLNRVAFEAGLLNMQPEEFVQRLIEDYLESTELLPASRLARLAVN